MFHVSAFREQRHAVRLPLGLTGQVLLQGAVSQPVQALNVSPFGLCLQVDDALDPAAVDAVQMDKMGCFGADIRWVRENALGIYIKDPGFSEGLQNFLYQRTLQALRRGAVLPASLSDLV